MNDDKIRGPHISRSMHLLLGNRAMTRAKCERLAGHYLDARLSDFIALAHFTCAGTMREPAGDA